MRTKRRDKLAADFTCLYQNHSGVLITATAKTSIIVYMNAIFISRNGPITVFFVGSSLRLFRSRGSEIKKLGNPVHKIDNKMFARRYITVFFRKLKSNEILEYIITNIFYHKIYAFPATFVLINS